jgi:hypothetical protein
VQENREPQQVEDITEEVELCKRNALNQMVTWSIRSMAVKEENKSI